MSGELIRQDGHEIRKFKTLYRIDGLRYDRISATLDIIAKPGLDAWRREKGFEEADRLMKEAARTGTIIHGMVERIQLDDDPWPAFEMELDGEMEWIQIAGTELEKHYRAYVAWHERHVEKVLFVERVLWSEEYEIAGTFDNLVVLKNLDRFPGNPVALLDVKSSRWSSWLHRLQTACYRRLALIDRRLVPEIDLRGIIPLSTRTPGAEVRIKWYLDHEKEWLRYTAALELHHASMEWADDWKS
jgi:hypothetical protein